VVERGSCTFGLAVRIDRLHQVDLDACGRAGHRDVLVDVLALAAELALEREPEQIDPEPAQRELVGPAHPRSAATRAPVNGRDAHHCILHSAAKPVPIQ
jgi:hypothetical protein